MYLNLKIMIIQICKIIFMQEILNNRNYNLKNIIKIILLYKMRLIKIMLSLKSTKKNLFNKI